MLAPWKKSYDQPRQPIKKQRHYFANKGPSSQGYGFSSGHVWMWELDYKESWVPKNVQTTTQFALISHTSNVMFKILQAKLQQYVNHEIPDVQAGFRKHRGTRDQIANICWIIKKAREFQKNINFCFINYSKAFDYVDHNKLWKILCENSERDGNTRPPDLPPGKSVCRLRSNS